MSRATARAKGPSARVALELETERLRLRQFGEADLDAWARIAADAEVMRYLGGAPLSREEARCSLGYLIGHWRIRGFGLWAAEERRSGELVGRVGLYQPAGWPGLEVGWLVARERWGEGFASEGGAAAMRQGFERLGAKRLVSVIEPANAASIRVAERLGERFDRELSLHGRCVHLYAIERRDWELR